MPPSPNRHSSLTPTELDRLARLAVIFGSVSDRLEAACCQGLRLRIRHDQSLISVEQVNLAASVHDPDGHWVGECNGYLRPAPDLDDSTIVLNHVYLRASARGRDFSRWLLGELEAGLADLGLLRLRVYAFRLGAYVWAGCGFRFDLAPGVSAEREAFGVVDRAEYAGAFQALQSCAELEAHLGELLTRIEGRPERRNPAVRAMSAPSHFVDFVEEASGTDRDARADVVRTILAASYWHGVKELSSSQILLDVDLPHAAAARPGPQKRIIEQQVTDHDVGQSI